MNVDSPWLPFIYDYGVGGLLFATTIYLGIRVGAIDLTRPVDRRTLVLTVVGFLLFASVHAIWIAIASRSLGTG